MSFETFVKHFTQEHIPAVRIGKRYYQLPAKLAEVQKKISRDLFCGGIPLGEEKREFMPSIALLEMIAMHSDKKAVINKKSAWLFLCGRDVFAGGIISLAVQSGPVLVQNELDENLGLGMVERKGKTLIIKNVLDRGNFLRRER
ncbi:MAG: hypothetical protein V1725_07355 [archaeon]